MALVVVPIDVVGGQHLVACAALEFGHQRLGSRQSAEIITAPRRHRP
jgi:hypothetical protein